MKGIKKMICLVLAAVLLIGALGTTQAQAGDKIYEHVTVMKAGKTYALKKVAWFGYNADGSGKYNYPLYKVTVPADGYITVTVTVPKKEIGGYITLMDSKKKELSFDRADTYYSHGVSSGKTTKVNYALSKGTYYFRSSAKGTIKYTFTKAANKANYKKGNAIALDKKKPVIICATRNNDYDRWYKIKVTKTQQIHIYDYKNTDDGAILVAPYIYDSHHCEVALTQDSDGRELYTTSKVKPGTYYICINGYDVDSLCGRFIKWKWY